MKKTHKKEKRTHKKTIRTEKHLWLTNVKFLQPRNFDRYSTPLWCHLESPAHGWKRDEAWPNHRGWRLRKICPGLLNEFLDFHFQSASFDEKKNKTRKKKEVVVDQINKIVLTYIKRCTICHTAHCHVWGETSRHWNHYIHCEKRKKKTVCKHLIYSLCSFSEDGDGWMDVLTFISIFAGVEMI